MPSTAANGRDDFDTAHTILGKVIGETFGYILDLRMDAARRRQPRRPDSPDGLRRPRNGLGDHDPPRRVSPLDLDLIDTLNFFGYVLWSLWLIWLAIAVLRDARSIPTANTAVSIFPISFPFHTIVAI